MSKVLVVGEILIDLVQEDDSFKFAIGGAPFNVAYNLSSLGDEVTFIGQVGDDFFGNYIVEKISNKKNLSLEIEKLKDRNTTIALNVTDGKNRKYSFIRKNTADYMFNYEKIRNLDLKQFDLIHIGSLFLSNIESRKLFKDFILRARENNVPISFDVNFRSDIFEGGENPISLYKEIIHSVDFIKFSDEEISLFFNDIKDERDVFETIKPKCLVITKGSKGAIALTQKETTTQNSFRVKVKDTVGAGDSFYSGFLHFYLNLDKNENNFIHSCLEFASACGSLTCKQSGAINGYKSEEEVLNFLKKQTLSLKDLMSIKINK